MGGLLGYQASAATNTTSQVNSTNDISIPVKFKGTTALPDGSLMFQLTFGGPRTYFVKVGQEVEGFKIKQQDRVPNPRKNEPKQPPFLNVLTIERAGTTFVITNGMKFVFIDGPKKGRTQQEPDDDGLKPTP